MNIMVGRAIAAVGILLSFLGIWITAFEIGGFGVNYWDTDGTLGGFLLVLACLAVLLLVAALATGNPMLDVALAAVGGVIFGMYVFFPAVFAGGQWGFIGAGGWLGVCTVLIVVGALVAYLSARGPVLAERIAPSSRTMAAGAVAAVGLGLVLVALFLDVERGDEGSYWSVPENGSSLGIVFLLAIIACLLGLAAGLFRRMAVATLIAACAACVVFGLTFYIPVTDAFNSLDDLDIGAWLALVGGLIALAGALVAWHDTISRRVLPAAGTAPVPSAPVTSP